MYDIENLEEKWHEYQKNRKKPFIIGIFIFLALCGFFLLLWQYKDINFTLFSFDKQKKIDKPLVKKHTFVLIDNSLSTLQIHKKEIVQKIKPVVKLHMPSKNVNLIPTLPVVNDIPMFDVPPIKNKIVVSEAPKIKQVLRDVSHKKMHLNIIKSSTVSAYKDVEKRFYQSHDTDDSLFLAKSYYRKGNYEKSEYWSLQTNKINSNIEESWMIFVKSKMKLGYKNQAIRILTNYAKKSNSSNAWNLLLKLKK